MFKNIKLLPDKSKDYPLRFFFYWLVVWAFLFLYSTIIMIPRISNNGYTLRIDTCLEEGPAGRFDEYTKCYEYGDPKYVPVGKELISNFKSYGFGSFFIMFIVGWILWNGTRIQEQKRKVDTYDIPNSFGEMEKYTVGYSNNVKVDIYWDDVVASRNNIDGINLSDGTSIIISGSTKPAPAGITNKNCPFCSESVDKFEFLDNISKSDDDHGDSGFMEVCFKCKKILYYDINFCG